MAKNKLAQLPIKGPNGEEMIAFVLHDFEVGGDRFILYVEAQDSEEVIPAKLVLDGEDFIIKEVPEDEMYIVQSEFERFLDDLENEEDDEEDFDETGDYEEVFEVELDGKDDEEVVN